ncbi:hypothetical protein QO009_002148 [Brevibacillus aydinogluensis]|jgi:hypothetical protein|uniref:DUF3298 and DUF4163 domain-containing protein n=1 Tax=Brevibacillus aydinogluensis TaxID=927786 RepID=UPI000E37489F|nr:DUF3298 and DUF4163 domain-containing protein [Brevibacillus aydinogluensis]MDT3416280.1 hypothetical protein [Brevibacillus aydinogluensis]REK66315.1 MAG: hypothetical protein DF221_03685 [Brevibacillus sp.]
MEMNQLPTTVLTRTISRPNVTIYYPQVAGLANRQAEQNINQTLSRYVQDLINQQYESQVPGTTEMQGSYEIKNNQRGIFSVTLNNYAYTPPMAHGMTYMMSLTADVQTGQVFSLRDLFKPGSDYVKVLSDNIKTQIANRHIPTLEPFKAIRPDQDFYVADKALVIYFQLYEITPYYVGFPMFPISVFDLEPIISETGPLSIMATNS